MGESAKRRLALKVNWPRVLLAIIVVSVFFEGSGYSVNVFGFRMRSVQGFELLFFGLLFLLFLFKKWRWQHSPLDHWLLAYAALNFVAILAAEWKAHSLKIALLIASLAFLYWLVFQLLRTRQDFLFAFRVLLIAGTAQIGFGLYQVIAGAVDHYWGWRLPVGYAGVVHREFLGSPWGRPYGTLSEPDFYGAICLMFALVFSILYSTTKEAKRIWKLSGFLLSLAGLYFSFVRNCWILFVLLFLLLPMLRKCRPFFRFRWRPLACGVLGFIGFHFLAVTFLPAFHTIHHYRFIASPVDRGSLFNIDNVRFEYMRLSLRNFLRSPLIGNGPGSFSHFFWKNEHDTVGLNKKISSGQKPETNPSMLLTVLEDTGALGFLLLTVITGKFLWLGFKGVNRSAAPPAAQALALFVALVALFLTYLLTSGFWLPMTWVFLGISIAGLTR